MLIPADCALGRKKTSGGGSKHGTLKRLLVGSRNPPSTIAIIGQPAPVMLLSNPMFAEMAEKFAERLSSVPFRAKILLGLGIATCAAIFVFISKGLRVPTYAGYGGSILNEPGALGNLLLIGLGLVVCVLVGTLISGTIRFDAGLVCAAAGMGALSLRGGTAGDVLRAAAPADSPFVLVWMAVELAVLFALVGLAWGVLWLLHRQGWLASDEFRDGVEDQVQPIAVKLAAMGMQVGAMLMLLLLLGQTDAKFQALLGVGVSAFLAAWLASFVNPVSPSPWIWTGPLIVGVIGYVGSYFNPEGWKIGHVASALAPLARALPMDYATAGTAGAILGYWMVQREGTEVSTETAPASGEQSAAGSRQ